MLFSSYNTFNWVSKNIRFGLLFSSIADSKRRDTCFNAESCITTQSYTLKCHCRAPVSGRVLELTVSEFTVDLEI